MKTIVSLKYFVNDCRFLHSKSKIGIEIISVEINSRKRKWFFICFYNPNKNHTSNHLECLNPIMDEFGKNYDNLIFLGHLNTCINDNAMVTFCSLNDLASLTDQPTCYKTCSLQLLCHLIQYFLIFQIELY